MAEVIDDDLNQLSYQQFNHTMNSISKRPGKKYEFITQAGPALTAALFNVYQTVWETEVMPPSWMNTVLVQVYKDSGDRSCLDNYRHLHIKQDIPKVFGHMVMSVAKATISQNLTKFQIGARAGHRPQEHLFVLKSVMSLYAQHQKTLFLSMWDISKFFDRENLRDVMNEIYSLGVRGKIYRLIYQLNKNSVISVKTPVGLSDQVDTGEGVAQGSVEGASISAASLGAGVSKVFKDSCDEVNFAGLELGPLLFQDDVARLADCIASAQTGNEKMESLAEAKLLDFNLKKSCFMIIGNKTSITSHKEEIRKNPITLCKQPMTMVSEAKYLGDWICEGGLSESVVCTVRKRKGLAIGAIHEIRCVVEDCRSMICGGIKAGLEIWELAVLPMLLYNAESWIGVTKKTVEDLEAIQKRFLKHLLAVGSGCPTPSLYWETGTLGIKWRILKSKLLLYHHIKCLPNTALAKEVIEVQERLNLPGLHSECSDFLCHHGFTHVEQYTKVQWKKLVKERILKMNENELVEMSLTYKKINFSGEKFACKDYMKEMRIDDARTMFKIRTNMVPTVQMNFMGDKNFASNLWTCSGCNSCRDSQQHLLTCPGYAQLRIGKNLKVDSDLVAYYREILKHRQDG